MRKVVLFSLTFVLITVSIPSTFASRNGIERAYNTFTVGMTFENSSVPEICSGTLISPTFVMTVAHCVVNMDGNKHTNFLFTKPGMAFDAPINLATQPKILKTYIPQEFFNPKITEEYDVAFIQLDRPLATRGYIRMATVADIMKLSSKINANGYGYGSVFETSELYSQYAREYQLIWQKPQNINMLAATIMTSDISVACSGDSGGPITTILPTGEEVVIGALHSAAYVVDRCGTTAADGLFYMQVTLANKFISIIHSELKKSLTISKVYKITCLKGTTKKYVTGTNPKCPAGYKKVASVQI